MFATGRAEDARLLLERLVADPESQDDLRLWAQLFTLYRIRADWPRFDALAARFEARFQRLPPASPGLESPAGLPAALRAGGEAWQQISGALDARAIPRIEQVREKSSRYPSLHLDLTRVDGVDADGCAALSGLIRFLAANGNALLLSGTGELIELLRAAASGDGTLSAYWTLLLDLYQLEGRRVEFERAALEYALATGAPAPHWEAVVMPLPPRRQVREQRDEPRYQAGPEVLAVTGGGDEHLHAIDEFARDREYVNLDLEDLDHLAPVAARALVQLVNALSNDHVVRLLRPNALIEALLETLDLDPRVQLIRAQSL